MVAAWLEVALSFAPPSVLKRVFPPVVSGTAVFLIGTSLITAGIKCALARPAALPKRKYASTSLRNNCCCILHCFAALHQFDAASCELQKFRCSRVPLCAATGVCGPECASDAGGLPPQAIDCYDANGILQAAGTCFGASEVPLCDGNGDVRLPFGSPEYVGLGTSVFATLILVELFGSPAMRNTSVRPVRHTLVKGCLAILK